MIIIALTYSNDLTCRYTISMIGLISIDIPIQVYQKVK